VTCSHSRASLILCYSSLTLRQTSFLIFLVYLLLLSIGITHAFAEEGGPSLIGLQPYKPLYFLMGHPDTKIELSFKAKIVEATPIYFGYTQLMFWELFQSSPYFSELDYNPEIFYRLRLPNQPEQWFDFSPIEHESNGKGGSDERSWNRASIRFHSQIRLLPSDPQAAPQADAGTDTVGIQNASGRVGERDALYWSFKIWVPFLMNPNNSDIAKYRGIWELNVSLSDFLGPFFGEDDVTFRLYPGGALYINPFLGGQELTFRTKARDRKFLPLFVFQVFHGYAENLMVYNQSRLGLRAGVGF
jgi:outer membrane phospholipase A